jgi:SAM-dependent methyltransferase
MSMRRLRRVASLVRKERTCPFCGWRGWRFEPFGNRVMYRKDASCPGCGSLERHRLVYLLLKDRIPRGQKVLHAAPEPLMIRWLVSLSSEYLNVDLFHPAMRKMDLTAIELPDDSKTLIWCSHVLEHIPDDAKALSEFHRVLAPGGMLMLQVPIGGQVTYEDWTVVEEEDRLEKFLQEDHVRLYGLDLKDRIEAAGFECEVLSCDDFSLADRRLYGLDAPHFREVFFCRKPA